MLVLGLLFALQIAAGTGGKDPARDVTVLVAHARAARYQQDSTLASYRVIVRQRMSSSIGLARGLVGSVGRPRLAARIETVARLGWHHELGAWGEVLGARSVAPIVGEFDHGPEEDAALVLPYYPGRDRLWPIGELRRAVPIARDWIEHPLDAGADSLYDFAVGDSLAIRLPNGNVVNVREIRVRARRPESRLVVGSLWVDVASGSLVRAAYRPSVPMDLWPLMEPELHGDDDDMIKKLGPFTGIIREIVVDHGLHQGQFWLPRTRIANAEGTAKGARVTLSIEQTFRYEQVSALAHGERNAFVLVEDVDPRTGRVRQPRWRGVQDRTSQCRERGDSSSTWSPDSLIRAERLSVMYADGIRFRVLVPCDERDLLDSPELPQSIYDPGEALFTDTDLGALRKDVEGALGMSSQAEWEPRPATWHYGLNRGLLRYNRVEGLSVGAKVERVLGKGYTASATARLGVADLEPGADVAFARSNVSTELRASAYRRLAASNDWGDPFGVGASLLAAVFGRDDGFYYRTGGGELSVVHRREGDSPIFSLRLFGERHDVARVETQESVARLVSNTRFPPNIVARSGEYFGGVAAMAYAAGSNPRGTRLFGALRGEGAGGETAYGRFMMEHTINQGLPDGVQATLTGGAGTSLGNLPAPRLWYLGGPYTVRGYRAGELAGDAFWIGRAELAKGHPMVRPAVFADAGWAGSRRDWNRQQRPLIGVGAGATALDGLVRIDVSRGLERDRRWRIDAYLEVR